MMDETQAWDRRTGMDRIASYLYGEIVSLRLLPGAKISEDAGPTASRSAVPENAGRRG